MIPTPTEHQMTTSKPQQIAARLALAAALAFGGTPAFAHSPTADASTASAMSLLLPVAVSVAAPVALLSGGVALTVVSVQASAASTVWVLERASDGARASLTFAGRVAEVSVLGFGTAVAVTALSTGWVLSAAGHAIAFVPNEIGASLLHSEQLTR
jgi:hypothetical protein